MARSPKVVAEYNTAEATAMKLASPKTSYGEIGARLGLSASGAYQAIHRPLRKRLAANLDDFVDLHQATLDTMLTSLYPFVTGDVDIVLQWIEEWEDGKKTRTKHLDPEGRQYAYVLPSKAMLNSVDKMLKVLQQQSDLHGYKHSDNIAARKMQLEEEQTSFLIGLFSSVIGDDELALTQDQQKALKGKMAQALLLEAAKAEVEENAGDDDIIDAEIVEET